MTMHFFIVKNSDGLATLTQCGGAHDKALLGHGYARIICGSNFEKLTPDQIIEEPRGSGEQASFVLRVGYHVCSVLRHKQEFHIGLHRIEHISFEERIARAKTIFHFSGSRIEVPFSDDRALPVIEAAQRKSCLLDCKEIHYALEPVKKEGT